MNGELSPPNFVDYLKDIAGSPLAFVGYILVVFFWALYAWLNYKRSLIASINNDADKVSALEKLLGNTPPKEANPIDWLSLQLKGRIHRYFFISFLSSLLTAIILFAIASFKSKNDEQKSPSKVAVEKNDTLSRISLNDTANSEYGYDFVPNDDWPPTGDKVIDGVLKSLNSLEKKGKQNISQPELVSALRPLFSRPAFQHGIREESWEYFLFPLCRTRLLIEHYTSYFRDAKIRSDLNTVTKHMTSLQNDIAKIYGPSFSITEHISKYINDSKKFIDRLPNRVLNPDSKYFDERDKSIKQIRAILNPLGLSEK